MRREKRLVELVSEGGMDWGDERLQEELLAIVHRQHTGRLAKFVALEKHTHTEMY